MYWELLIGDELVLNSYEVLFRERLDAVETVFEDGSEDVHAVLFNLPYNICKIVDSASSGYIQLSCKTMSSLSDISSGFMDTRVHEHIFSSALYVKSWYELLEGEIKRWLTLLRRGIC